jgi:hypothetical protein
MDRKAKAAAVNAMACRCSVNPKDRAEQLRKDNQKKNLKKYDVLLNMQKAERLLNADIDDKEKEAANLRAAQKLHKKWKEDEKQVQIDGDFAYALSIAGKIQTRR